MDGVLVAYHNTERIFGFQYISLDEMDERLLGSAPGVGNKLFNHSVRLLEAILEEAATFFPGQVSMCNLDRIPTCSFLISRQTVYSKPRNLVNSSRFTFNLLSGLPTVKNLSKNFTLPLRMN